jgi:hypothetical protein
MAVESAASLCAAVECVSCVADRVGCSRSQNGACVLVGCLGGPRGFLFRALVARLDGGETG